MRLHITGLKFAPGFLPYHNLNISVVLWFCVLLLESTVMSCTVLFSVSIRSFGDRPRGAGMQRTMVYNIKGISGKLVY